MKPPFRNLARPKPAANSAASAAVQAKFNEALALHQKHQLAQAQALYQQVLKLQPRHFDALHLMGVIAIQTNNPLRAIELIGRAIELNPDNAAFYIDRGNALKALKRPDEALESYERALAIRPDYAGALYNRGNVLQDLGRLAEALESYDRALAIKPDFAEALSNRGNALKDLKRLDDALESYERALAIKPDYAEALSNRGVALRDLKRFDEALESYGRALTIRPDYAEALSNRGVALQDLNRLDEALASYDRALAIEPGDAEVLSNRGVALQDLKRLDEALESYERALAIKPDYAEALYNRGNALKDLKRLDEALASYERALKIRPDDADALYNRGVTLTELKRLDEALASYARALQIKPDYGFLYGTRLYTKLKIGDWSDAENQFAHLAEKIERNEKAAPPFAVMAMTDSLPLQKKAAEIWVRENYPGSPALPAIPKRARHPRIRIGYFSADFRDHPVAILTAGLFESHDRTKFEVTAFSFGPDSNDEMRKRLIPAFDRFIDVRNQSDKEVAQLARNLGIDVAIDMGGLTQDCRTGIFAMRAAPVQINFLGYPGTMGAEFMDYLIADTTIVPKAYQCGYSEKLAYLPSYQPNDATRLISEKRFTRAELGLPDRGFVFCCFNNNCKITPATFDGWMRILRQAEGSVLWLREDNPTAARNLRKEAEARGVNAARLIFAKRMPLLAEHLARHRAADLFIDTLPYNAHTTASDALWAGLPVLTCMGEAFASRVAASLLNAIDLPELITTTQAEYEALAVEFAANPQRLRQIRQKLEGNRLTTPLFDTRLFTRHLEDAYAQMYERYQADLPPEHIYVALPPTPGM